MAAALSFALFLCVEAVWDAKPREPLQAHSPLSAEYRGLKRSNVSEEITLRVSSFRVLKEAQTRMFSDDDYPRVYMYDLGKEFRESDCSEFKKGSQAKIECVFGPTFDLHFEGGKSLKCHTPDQFALGRIFYERMQTYRRRVHSPEQADLFYIPSYRDSHNHDSKYFSCPDHEQSKRVLTFFNYTTAPRHFIVSPRVSTRGLCPAYIGDSSSPNVQKISVLSIESIFTEGVFSIPYPSVACGLTRTGLNQLLVESRMGDRAFLATGSFGFHGPWIQLRSSLYDQCEAAFDCLHSSQTDIYKDYRQNSLKATFCLQPPGDSLSRKGIIDSIVLGCIPVLFQPLQESLWPWHMPLSNLTVMIATPHRQSQVMQELRQIKAEKIKELQANLLKFATRATYGSHFAGNIENTYEDAFDAALINVWRAVKTDSTKQWKA